MRRRFDCGRGGSDLGLAVCLCASAAIVGAGHASVPWIELSVPWIELVEQTDQRLDAPLELGKSDTREKMYVWGDLNKNGWVDLVVIRKQPFFTEGKEPNLLLMNENGVLVDRTAQYASAVAQDQLPDGVVDNGFLTPTNDRFAVLADLNDNEWLDLAIAVEMSDGAPKHIGFPRIYMNLGNDVNGDWLGLRFENDRIPHMCSKTGDCTANPRFTTVDAGDVTNNGLPDLYFGDHDAGGGFGFPQPEGHDFDNRLLINQTANPGYFFDGSLIHMGSLFNYGGAVGVQNYLYSAVGSGAVIADFTGNGLKDVAKITTLSLPTHVAVKYNNPSGTGTDGVFQNYTVINSQTPYSIAAADLNNNGRLDLVVGDDFVDGIILNLATNPDGTVQWSTKISLPGLGGFVSNITVTDLNNNGWNDIIIADMSVEIPGCNRATNIYGNDAVEGQASFSNVSSVIPEDKRKGTFAVAALDLTGNGWTDLVFGRCFSTEIWINVPLEPSLEFAYPQGKPSLIKDGQVESVVVHLAASNGELDTESVLLHAAVGDSAFEASAMSSIGDGLFTASLPLVECGELVEWHVTAEVSGVHFSDPQQAPVESHSAFGVGEPEVVAEQDFDVAAPGWTVTNDPSLTQGAWQLAQPTGAMLGPSEAAPFGDSSPGGGGQAFVTCAGCVGSNCVTSCNVQGGPTELLSPVLDLAAMDAIITYDRWLFCNHVGVPGREDFLETWVSNDGGTTWLFVHKTGTTNSQWETASFIVSHFVEPTSQVQVKFSVMDNPANSITNAGIDNFVVEEIDCADEPVAPCPADITGDGVVDIFDLLDVLAQWGPCGDPTDCPADLTGDGVVDIFDLLEVLASWGECP